MKNVKKANINLNDFYFKYEINGDGIFRYQWIAWAKSEDQARHRLICSNLPMGLTTGIVTISEKKSDIPQEVLDRMRVI